MRSLVWTSRGHENHAIYIDQITKYKKMLSIKHLVSVGLSDPGPIDNKEPLHRYNALQFHAGIKI